MKSGLRWVSRAPRSVTVGVFFALLIVSRLSAQYVAPYVSLIGTLSSAGGTPAANGTLTFTPSQIFFVAGTQIVVSPAQCSTDANGAVVGLPNPVVGPQVSTQTGVGTLPAGNYYVKFAWYDQFGGISLASPEVARQLTATGELQILPPAGAGPANAVGIKVYIGTTPGSETLQGQTTSPTAQYTQAAALATGQPSPGITNTSICRVVANDAGWPTGTGYTVSLVDASGNTLFNYTELWQFLGAGSTYNLSIGIPYYHGQVTYPVPILSTPYNHNPQSISGPLSLTGYNLYNVGAIGVGTALPGYGVDAEGTGLDSEINANGGYWVNGLGGTSGQTDCLASVNAGPFNTPVPCVTSLPTVFYQTFYQNGTPFTQEPAALFQQYFSLGTSLSPAGTLVNLNVVSDGTETHVATTGSIAGASGNLADWDSHGGIGDAGISASVLPNTRRLKITTGICSTANTAYATCTFSATWSLPFADTNYIVNCSAQPPSTGLFLQAYASAYSTTGFTVTLQNGDTSAAVVTTTSEVDCLGTHL